MAPPGARTARAWPCDQYFQVHPSITAAARTPGGGIVRAGGLIAYPTDSCYALRRTSATVMRWAHPPHSRRGSPPSLTRCAATSATRALRASTTGSTGDAPTRVRSPSCCQRRARRAPAAAPQRAPSVYACPTTRFRVPCWPSSANR
jgi:hypothetical protein